MTQHSAVLGQPGHVVITAPLSHEPIEKKTLRRISFLSSREKVFNIESNSLIMLLIRCLINSVGQNNAEKKVKNKII